MIKRCARLSSRVGPPAASGYATEKIPRVKLWLQLGLDSDSDFFFQIYTSSRLFYQPVEWNHGCVCRGSCHSAFFPVEWSCFHASPYFLEAMEFRVLRKKHRKMLTTCGNAFPRAVQSIQASHYCIFPVLRYFATKTSQFYQI